MAHRVTVKFYQDKGNLVSSTWIVHSEITHGHQSHYRFITHLKFFAKRLIGGKTYQDEADNQLLAMVKNQYQNAYSCVERIGDFLSKKYQYCLSDEEKLYLTIHIERVIYKTTS